MCSGARGPALFRFSAHSSHPSGPYLLGHRLELDWRLGRIDVLAALRFDESHGAERAEGSEHEADQRDQQARRGGVHHVRRTAVSEQDRAVSPRKAAVARAAVVQAITVAGAAPLASECAIGIDLAALAPEADVTDALVRRAPRAARGTTYAVARARLPSEPNVARAAELTVPAVVARRARTCAVEALAMARAANGTVDTGAPCAIVAAVAGAAAARATWMHRVVGSGVATTPHRSQCNRCKGTLSYMPCIGALAHAVHGALVPRQNT